MQGAVGGRGIVTQYKVIREEHLKEVVAVYILEKGHSRPREKQVPGP